MDGLTEHQNVVRVSRVCDVDFTRQRDEEGAEQFGDHVDYRDVEREQWEAQIGWQYSPAHQKQGKAVFGNVYLSFLAWIEHLCKNFIFCAVHR